MVIYILSDGNRFGAARPGGSGAADPRDYLPSAAAVRAGPAVHPTAAVANRAEVLAGAGRPGRGVVTSAGRAASSSLEFLFGLRPVPLRGALGAAQALPDGMRSGAHLLQPIRVHLLLPEQHPRLVEVGNREERAEPTQAPTGVA